MNLVHHGRQRGAVLYVALVLLVILSLIGVSTIQVTGLQERMAAGYYAQNRAFENAEDLAREQERVISLAVNGGSGFAADVDDCGTVFNSSQWSSAQMASDEASGMHSRRIDRCSPALSSIKAGAKVNEGTDQVYQITAFSRDRAADDNPSAQTAVDTIYIP